MKLADSLPVLDDNFQTSLPGLFVTGSPMVVYIVDRGDPANRTSDIGAMELYAASVVASDPFVVARALDGTPPE